MIRVSRPTVVRIRCAPVGIFACVLGMLAHATTWASPDRDYAGSNLEGQLAQIVAAIDNRQIDTAIGLTDRLLMQYPTFRLGHLIKGDLLLARGQAITTLGAAPNAPTERLSDLRQEAIARLRAYRDRPAPNVLPRYLLQMRSDQKYAVVVDLQKSRLYVYENDDGKPRFVADYYVAHGRAGTDKSREGDQKTPIGVYHVTANLPRNKLSDFYGSGAFPINYPNDWDRRQGRGGHGIWLHGTPSDTFSRPPFASDGCVVLANEDLTALAKHLQVGLTPVIISDSVEWRSYDEWRTERSALREAIEAWKSDWESRDVERYLSHYSRSFSADRKDLAQFSRQKRRVATGKTWIKIDLDEMSMFRRPGTEEIVVVTFLQNYRSNNLNNKMWKRQYWIREDGDWKIVDEGSA